MRFAVIASGSRANCTFVEGAGTRVLIDCGLSAKQAAARLAGIGVDADSIDALIITHEHSDHIGGVPVFSRRHRVPVYANQGAAACLDGLHELRLFETGRDFQVGSIKVSPFSIVHDAADPVGFVLEAEGCRFGQATDLGKVTTLVREALRACHAVLLEANHDPQLLRDCGYPWELKQRIASAAGHLSNDDAAALIAELRRNGLLHVALGHLSENSNTPQAALKVMRRRFDIDKFESFFCAAAGAPSAVVEVSAGRNSEIDRIGNY